ncbi:MAG TPA: zinc ABC transporter substrate-binding protein [Verrucomicrobiales bacterium]|nr:zinc ABC transporter substrate-binding protein [Verrucomicrobiales bacterium]
MNFHPLNRGRRLLRAGAAAALALGLFTAAVARAELNVVATMPDLGALAEAVGAGKVKVTSLARPTEDAHFVTAKPSFIRVLNRADVLIEGGAELEVGWLPPLVEGARNREIIPGGSRRVDASKGLQLLDVPTGPVDRSQGHVHAAGNAHYLLDPVRAGESAGNITEAFARLDPANAAAYRAALESFRAELAKKLPAWEARLKPFAGAKVVTYHKSFDYLLDRFGLEFVGTIEPKPGVEPSPTHINALVPQLREQGVRLILIEEHRPTKTPQYVAEKAGAKLIVLPHFPGSHRASETYLEWMDHLVIELADALKQP